MPASRGLPLARTLPLLTTGVVTAVLGTALVAIWLTLTRAAIETAQRRVEAAARQLAIVAETNVRQGRARYAAAAGDSAVLAAVTTAEARHVAAARTALARLRQPADSGMPIELWTADGRRLAFLGRDLQAPVPNATGGEGGNERAGGDAATRVPPRPGLEGVRLAGDTVRLGALYAADGRVHFWLLQPVLRGDSVVGYITHQRRLARNPQTEQTVRALAGRSVSAFYRNRDGGFWSTIGGVPAAPPERERSGTRARRSRPGLGALVYAEAAVPGTPLVFTIEMPRAAIVASADSTVRQLALLSFVLTVLGATVAWLIARRLTQPLVHVTDAAEAVASGDYAVRVPATGPDEVARLATSFNRMAEQVGASVAAVEQREGEMRALAEAAESANRAKSDFLATMSHELRTPLNAIGGYVELIEMELRGPVTEAQRRDLARIRASQAHLLGLISAVLDLSRIEAGRVAYDLAPVAVDPVLAGIDTLVAPQAAAKSIVLAYAPCPPELGVLADREKLRQILLNLLSNAIRHTPAGGTVSLAAVGTPHGVEISVTDTGPGIPADRQAAIFEPFVQLDRSLTSSRDGVGLGLSISRDLARGMHGDLTVESQRDHGARFVVTLPAAVADPSTMFASDETEAPRLPHDGTPASGMGRIPAR